MQIIRNQKFDMINDLKIKNIINLYITMNNIFLNFLLNEFIFVKK